MTLSPEKVAAALRSGRVVNPSRTDPWTGTPVAGSPWTLEQGAVLHREGRDPARVKSYTLNLPGEQRSDFLPVPAVQVEVPVIARTRTGKRILIVAPAGDKLWVDAK